MYMTIHVQWPGHTSPVAEVWRILDLSGMTNNPRQSRQYTLAGFAYLNGNQLFTLRDRVAIGDTFILELRFPGGKVVSQEIYLSARMYNPMRKPRYTHKSLNYRG